MHFIFKIQMEELSLLAHVFLLKREVEGLCDMLALGTTLQSVTWHTPVDQDSKVMTKLVIMMPLTNLQCRVATALLCHWQY